MAGGMSLKEVKRLGEELLASKAHINNAPALLSLLSKALEAPSSSASSEECLVQALLSLQAFFSPLLSSGELSSLAVETAQHTLQQSAGGEPAHQAQAVYLTWLWDKYNAFLDVLLKFFVSPSVSWAAQVASIDALMEFVRQEQQGQFSNRLYSKLCSTLVLSKDFKSEILVHLVTGYFNYLDVCCHTCINLRKLILSYHKPKHQGMEAITSDGSVEDPSLQSLLCNICDILTRMNVPKTTGKDSKNAVIESWSKSKVGQDDDEAADGKTQETKIKKTTEKGKELQDVKKLKSKISRVWMTFLRLPLSGVVYEKVLGHMHKTIIPNLINPVLLSDFLTNSYNKGGLISVMALSGLFVLITEYGLEYPDFYNKLYALLEPSMFIAKYRARFFELLDLSLKSPLLPSYLAAAFAKKLGRMALKSPPAGALIVIAIVHNLLRRHPSINCLVHQNYQNAELPLADAQESGVNHVESAATNGNESQGLQPAGERLGADPFLALESDPAKSNALKSSLWEMDTLRRHYCPAVSRFVASLETDLTVRAKTTELAIKDFSSGSYATIFSEEVKRRMKQVPLAFYNSIPTTLFPKASESEPPGMMDFPGWSFSCKQSFDDVKHNISNNGTEHNSIKSENVDELNAIQNEISGKETTRDQVNVSMPILRKKRKTTGDQVNASTPTLHKKRKLPEIK